ncbi:MAG: hypothetical protein R3C10_26815 [Pirellulales bacterium]
MDARRRAARRRPSRRQPAGVDDGRVNADRRHRDGFAEFRDGKVRGDDAAAHPIEHFVSLSLANPTDGGRFNGKIERYAGRLMAKYDLNGDLLLEQSEWIAMHGDPAGTMDLDGDGVITIDEIVNRVSDYGRRSLRVVPNVPLHFADTSQDTTNIDAASRTTYRVHPDDSQANDSANGQPNSPEVRMMRRFFVIPSQLPQGIAGWFLDNDADGDGQVTMAEFSANWTEVEAAQFASYDLNGDGVITAAECVRAETARAEREAAEARGAATAPTNDESGAVAADSAG